MPKPREREGRPRAVRGRRRAESRARYVAREEAQRGGWNLAHIRCGGDCVEENEIADTFPDIGLGLEKPDFLFCLNGQPAIVLETKNAAGFSQEAINEAMGYTDAINATHHYNVNLAVGFSGEEDRGYILEVRFFDGRSWKPLKSNGYELTNIPTKAGRQRAAWAWCPRPRLVNAAIRWIRSRKYHSFQISKPKGVSSYSTPCGPFPRTRRVTASTCWSAANA